MSTPDPFGDALAAQAQTASNDDAFGAALAAHAASTDDSKESPKRVGWAEENLVGPSEVLGSSIANIPHAAAHGVVDMYRRLTGGDTDAPDPEAVRAIKVPMGAGGEQLIGDARALLNPTHPPTADDQIDAIRQKALGPQNATVSNVLGHAGQVASDVGAIAAPVAAVRALGAPLGAAETALPVTADQAAREAVLRRVGVPEARVSALQGDASAAANDYQEAKLTSPNGLRMKQVIDNERQALSDHADSIVEGTGGTPGSAADEATRTERGNNILKPLDDLKTHFDTQTKALYDEANKRAAGQPVTLSKFKDVLGDASELTNSDRVHLVGGVNAYLGKLKMAGEDGTVSGNVTNAETVRKYLNENWSPQNSKLVGKLKDALDDDVTQSAGSDVYAQARAMRTLRGNTLDNPNGIAKLMDASGPNGINRVVPTEKVADAVTSMPVDQLNHVVKTLKNLPPDLQESGNLALSEIKAHMASKVADAGQGTSSMWNAKGVNQMLTKNSQRMQTIFEPEELENFKDLRDAGDILKKDQSYPGAAVQEHNLMQRGAMAALRGGSTALGAHVLGPPGAVAGEALGSNLANRFSAKAAMKNVESRIKPLDQ